MRYWLAGGGCYGGDYVRQLFRARQRNAIEFDELVVIDHNQNPAVFRGTPRSDLRHLQREWEHCGAEFWSQRLDLLDDQWVPPPLAPHILFHWLSDVIRLETGFTCEAHAWGNPPSGMPFAEVIREGTLVLSHAPGICPVHCIEPDVCPLTKGPRDWEMRETVAELAEQAGYSAACTFTCQHHAYGVGTIPFRDIFSEFERIVQKVKQDSLVAVATVSSCHGIVDGLRVR